MTDKTILCRLDDIDDGGSQRFTADVNGKPSALLAVRTGERVFVYVNSCPHIGAPLDLIPGQFLSADGTHILCANHGALFAIENGNCVHGPCSGEGLNPVAATVKDGIVFLTA